MAIIRVTRKTFSSMVAEKIDNMGLEGMLLASFMGGSDKLKEKVASAPEEVLLWVNTDHVAAVSNLTKIEETDDVVFRIFFRHPDEEKNPVWIKGDEYEQFLKAWSGECRMLGLGEYKIPKGLRAISVDDGAKVIVEADGQP